MQFGGEAGGIGGAAGEPLTGCHMGEGQQGRFHFDLRDHGFGLALDQAIAADAGNSGCGAVIVQVSPPRRQAKPVSMKPAAPVPR